MEIIQSETIENGQDARRARKGIKSSLLRTAADIIKHAPMPRSLGGKVLGGAAALMAGAGAVLIAKDRERKRKLDPDVVRDEVVYKMMNIYIKKTHKDQDDLMCLLTMHSEEGKDEEAMIYREYLNDPAGVTPEDEGTPFEDNPEFTVASAKRAQYRHDLAVKWSGGIRRADEAVANIDQESLEHEKRLNTPELKARIAKENTERNMEHDTLKTMPKMGM